jgi:hypothetical protein
MTFVDAELPATCPAVRVFRRTWTATDACSNAASCSQTITFIDTIPPEIVCAPEQSEAAGNRLSNLDPEPHAIGARALRPVLV